MPPPETPAPSLAADLIPALLPAWVWLGMTPLSIYLPNQEALDHSPWVLAPFAGAFTAALILTLLLFTRLRPQVRSRLAAALFFLGIFALAADLAAPLNLDPLLTGAAPVPEPQGQAVRVMIWAGLAAAGFLAVPWRIIRGTAAAFTLALMVLEAVHGADAWESPPGLNPPQKPALAAPAPGQKRRPGIFHITFDGMGGPAFKEALENGEFQDSFQGFTLFENNLSNHLFTNLSLPSYMTGTFLEPGGAMQPWRLKARTGGVLHAARQGGWEVRAYVPFKYFQHVDANHTETYWHLLRRHGAFSTFCQFADLWLARAVPVFFRQEVRGDSMGPFTWLFIARRGRETLDSRPWTSLQAMRRIIREEAAPTNSPRYIYAHLYLPHPPFVFTPDCGHHPEQADCQSQAACAVRLMAELTEALKEAGAWDGALILFHSDHGDPGCPSPLSGPLARNMEALEPNLRGLSAQDAASLARSLLFIKPPHASGPMAVSEDLTQLADIPATLSHLAGLPEPGGPGRSVFSLGKNPDREIGLFIGWRQQSPGGTVRIWGKNLFSGELSRFAFTPSRGWEARPPLAVRWE